MEISRFPLDEILIKVFLLNPQKFKIIISFKIKAAKNIITYPLNWIYVLLIFFSLLSISSPKKRGTISLSIGRQASKATIKYGEKL